MVVTEKEFANRVWFRDGICVACKKWVLGGIPPDAEGQLCLMCGKHGVVGMETAVIFDVITFDYVAAAPWWTKPWWVLVGDWKATLILEKAAKGIYDVG